MVIWESLKSANSPKIEVNLKLQTVHLPDGKTLNFEIDPFRKQCLLEGLDDIDLTLKYSETIEQHEANEKSDYPWTRIIY